MKRWIWISAIGVIAVMVIVLIRPGSSEGNIRRLIRNVQTTASDGINRQNPDALDTYFATIEEGAQENGLSETQGAYKTFVTLMNRQSVQIHSFHIDAVEVREDAGMARVTYQMHLSVIRDREAVFTVRFTQDIAVLRTPRGWRISGGDSPQIAETTGIWAPR